MKMTTIGRHFQAPASSFFLFGPRGTGKSTWLRERFPDAVWIDLLRPEEHREYAARPERLRERLAASPEAETVVIDEIQRVPELLDVVHELIESRRPPPRFVLTGSSARKLRRGGVNLLAGRALLRRLHPFMASELGAERFDLGRALQLGMLPLVLAAEAPEEVLKAYVGLYLREEVQAEGIVRNLGAFSRFLEAVSFSHAAQLNLADVARDCQTSRSTVEGYLAVLEDLLLAFRLPVFTRRARRQVVARPKLYWFDAGVFRSIRPTGPLDRPQEIGGAALEGLVAQHLRAWIDYSGGDDQLAYWRTRAGTEVDFVVHGPAGFWAFEVKHTATLRPRDVESLRAFGEDYPEANLRLLYRGSEPLEIAGVRCLPCERYLLQMVPGRPLP
jgi:predicted AAA+ superfamily ATPase